MVLQEDPSSVPILDKGVCNIWLKVCSISPEFRILLDKADYNNSDLFQFYLKTIYKDQIIKSVGILRFLGLDFFCLPPFRRHREIPL